MNNGAFGENFPYSNFHDLNMDWIIKIAKDFLDQYTNIQNTIDEGLESLDTKATQLEALLQAWYDTHSSDIANQLATALAELAEEATTKLNEFNTEASAIGQSVIASIPVDYTALSNIVDYLNKTAISLYGTTENYAPLNEIPSGNNVWYEYPVKITPTTSDIIVKFLSQTSLEAYANMELYNGDTFVWRAEPATTLVFLPPNGQKTYTLPKNITADKIRVLNRNGRTGLFFSILSSNYSFLEDDSLYNKLTYLNSFGLASTEIVGEALAGASISGNTITIPAGSTGYNSYFTLAFPWTEINKYAHAGKEAVCITILESDTDITNIAPLLFNANRGTAGSKTKLLTVMNNVYVYETTFLLRDTYGTSNEFTYCQFKTPSTLSTTAHITCVAGYLLWDSFNQTLYNELYALAKKPTTLQYFYNVTSETLRSVIEQAGRIASKYNPVIVEYYGFGNTYNLLGDFTQEELTTSSTYIGLTIPAYVTLQGQGGWQQNKFSLTLPDSIVTDVKNRISAINLLENGQLEGVWFKAKNCRYACHDDMQTSNPEWTLKTIKDCKFTSDYTTQHRAYGAGIRSGVNWKFENCIFENLEGHEFGNAAFSVHNNVDITRTPHIDFINCQFYGGQGVTLESLNRHQTNSINDNTIVNFYGCKAENYVWAFPIIATLTDGTALEFNISGCCNSFGNNEVKVYYNASFTHAFDEQITVWGKVTE